VIGTVPVHVPEVAVRVCPSTGSPLIDGAAVLDGATPVTGELTADAALADPAVLVAVTRTTNALPTSAPASVYACAVAPVTSTQLLPSVLQRRHWYAYEIGVDPDQMPGDAVSVCPSWVVPVIVGAVLFAGGTPDI
jgi:hypothetical protein